MAPRFTHIPEPLGESEAVQVWEDEPREEYPEERLKHRFVPVGNESAAFAAAQRERQAALASRAPAALGKRASSGGAKKKGKRTATTTKQKWVPEGQEPPAKKRKTAGRR